MRLRSLLPPRRRHQPTRRPSASATAPTLRGVRDLLLPGSIREHPRCLEIGDRYHATLAVRHYPREVGPNLLEPLLMCGIPLRLVLHPHALDPVAAKGWLRERQRWLAAEQLGDEQAGDLPAAETTLGLADADALELAIEQRAELLYECSLYVAIEGSTPEELEERVRHVQEQLDGLGLRSIRLLHEAVPGYQATLPIALDVPRLTHPLTATVLAAAYPFAGGDGGQGQVVVGLGLTGGQLVAFDPFDAAEPNPHTVIGAPSGAGKSYLAKLIVLRALPMSPDGAGSGCDAWLVDPEGEFVELTTYLGGRVISLSLGDHGVGLNPLDLPPAETDPDPRAPPPPPVTERIAAVTTLIGLLAGEGGELTHVERNLVARAVRRAYAAAGIGDDATTHHRPAPTLADVQEILAAGLDDAPADRAAATAAALAQDLALRLELYTHGEYRGLFSRRTEGDFAGRVVCWNLRNLDGLPPELKRAALFLLTDSAWTQLRRQRRNRLLVVDEAHHLAETPAGGQLLAGLVQRGRKWNVALVVVCQDLVRLFASAYGRDVAVNAARVLLGAHSPQLMPEVARVYRLGAGEAHWLSQGARRGQVLVITRQRRLAVDVMASPEEHEVITTDAQELLARERERQRRLTGGR